MAQGFKKFMDKGDSGSKKKERIRQEKKKVRQETKEYFEKKKQEAREARAQGQAGYKKAASFKPKAESRGNEATRHKGIEKAASFKPQAANNTGKAQKAGAQPQTTNNKPQTTKAGAQPETTNNKPQTAKAGAQPQTTNNKLQTTKAGAQPQTTNNKPQTAKAGAQPQTSNHKPQTTNYKPQTTNNKPETAVSGSMPLNKFIAHAGICSRRDAAEMVKAGKVIVNGEKITEPGHKVTDKDDIKVNGKKLHIRKNLVYILLNKPKDYITTTEDPQGRKTVLDIIRNATPERVYPIGRLDRNTTGVLLLTNDGELAQKLSHPSYEIKKIYEVKLDKPLVKKDFDNLLNGVTLEDGFVAPDGLAYADPKDKSVIGIEIHSGRNRIVRRIFEHLGYDVRNLDRVMYANLTKKNVDRGKWRFLTEKEVRLLKYLNASYTKNKTVARG
ncbi:pseudouridine synthase [Niastella caeni]|uniref:Pseudouridine synthase n=1 Tax=Niastella caeni TaxID=2569763 RepID=A0A4S8HZN2_9BACT|nr:pseudouridine synthase [Niastella caeni]THU41273.1 pseudouridine synthase [Niastella caeni]